MLDVKRLRILSEVSCKGSFSAAAESLYLSQSAVSQQVATLEREVGMPLLDRANGGPTLTAAGEALLKHTDAVVARLEEAERELSSIAGLEAGRLRIASFPSASATLVTGALSAFRAKYPGIELHFSEYEPEDSLPQLRRGELDVAVVFDYPAFPAEVDRDVENELLLTESMHVALPRDHPLASAESVNLADLADEAWLCGSRPSLCAEILYLACRAAGFEPKVSFESDDYSVQQGFVAGGLGVTLLPDLALATLRSDVVVRPIKPETPERRVWAAIRGAGSRSPAAVEMVAMLKAQGERLAGDAASAAGTAPRRRPARKPKPVPA